MRSKRKIISKVVKKNRFQDVKVKEDKKEKKGKKKNVGKRALKAVQKTSNITPKRKQKV